MAPDFQTNYLFDKVSRFFSRALVPVALPVFAVPFVGLLFCASMNTDDYPKATLSWCAGTPLSCVRHQSVLAITWMYYSQLS
jgi:hypothetical protein